MSGGWGLPSTFQGKKFSRDSQQHFAEGKWAMWRKRFHQQEHLDVKNQDATLAKLLATTLAEKIESF